MNDFFGTYTIKYENSNAILSQWRVNNGIDILLQGENIKSLVDLIKSIRKRLFFYDLSEIGAFIHYYCVYFGEDIEVFEKGGIYYRIKIKRCEILGVSNIFKMPYEMDLREFYLNKIESLKDILTRSGAVYTAGRLEKFITISSVAFSAFREITNHEVVCPKIYGKDFFRFVPWMRGGIVYNSCNGNTFENVHQLDFNGMYSHAYGNYRTPIASPHFCRTEKDLEKFDFRLYKIVATYKHRKGLKNIGKRVLDCGSLEYKDVAENEILYMTNYDMEIAKENYDFDYTFVEGWGFRSTKEKYKAYADFFEREKYENPYMKPEIKYMLNTPAGKAAANGKNSEYHYFIDESGMMQKEKVNTFDNIEAYHYIPFSIAVYSIGRNILSHAANHVSGLLYTDTDSMKFTGDIPNDLSIGNKPGQWKDEGTAEFFKALAPKCYIKYQDGKIKCTCAGVPEDTLKAEFMHDQECTKDQALRIFDKFTYGKEININIAVSCPGGRKETAIKRNLAEVIQEII